jgi:tetratricopeptide (TPR) repeat protein
MRNPFVFGRPAYSAEEFSGRRYILGELLQLIAQGQPCSVVGERRVGKTSLLLHIEHLSSRDALESTTGPTLAVYFDFQGHENLTAGLFWRTLVSRAASQARSQDISQGVGKLLTQLEGTEELDFTHIRKLAITCAQSKLRLLLLLDEFEYVADSNALGQSFFAGLRSLVASSLPIACIITSRKRLSEIERFASRPSFASSPFFNVFNTLSLGVFEPDEAEALIARALQGAHTDFNAEDMAFLYDLSGHHPFLLQMAAYYLFEEKRRESQSSELEKRLSARARFDSQCRDHFDYYWRHSTAAEKAILAAYATDRQLPTEDSTETQRKPFWEVVRSLVDRSLLIPSRDQAGTYRLVSTSLADWILETTSPEAVLSQVPQAVVSRAHPILPFTPPAPPDANTLPVPGSLPPGSRLPFARNALFTGRQEPLKALARALLHGEGPFTLVTQAVLGLGGVGKTQLVVEFAYRYGRFFHGVHWINAGQPEYIDDEVAACGAAMALPGWPEKVSDQTICTLDAWQRGGPRLVVLDSLEDVGAAQEWLACLGGGPVRLLITTRRAKWPGYLGMETLSVEGFSAAESRRFLRLHLSERRATNAELRALARRLDGFPLALEIAGLYLKSTRVSVAKYLEGLDNVCDDLAPATQDWLEKEFGSPTAHKLNLAATLDLSWERVADEAARRVFLLAGFCAPNQPIPWELLEQAAELEEKACDEAVGTLAGLGLLEMEDAEAGPAIHPLLAEYARTVSTSEEGVLSALGDALATLAERANESNLPACFAPLRPHVEVVAPAAEEAGVEQAGMLWNEMGCYLHAVADYATARAAFERALAIDEQAFGPDHPNVARDINNLGWLLRDLGDLATARAAFERALAIDEQAFGPDHPNVARDINNLGWLLRDLGDLAAARAAFERALAIRETVFGQEHPDTATILWWLGTLERDSGNIQKAQAYLEEALAIFEQSLSLDHPYTQAVREGLADLEPSQ